MKTAPTITIPHVFYLVVKEDREYFRVTVTEAHESLSGSPRTYVSVMGTVDEATSWGDDGPGDFEHYLDFYMKWDGCCHINFGDKGTDGYLHLCSRYAWENHKQLMDELWQWAVKALPMEDW
jgi:hypothetical protein